MKATSVFTLAAEVVWRSTRGALIAVALGAIAALGGRGLADAGVDPVWIWLWGIVGFIAFAAGLSFWAISAPKRWTAATATRPADRPPPRAAATPSTETVTYWYIAVVALLCNVLATAALIACLDVAERVLWWIPVDAVCNLAGYVIVLGALRRPATDRPQSEMVDASRTTHQAPA